MPTIEQAIIDLDQRMRRLEQGPRNYGPVHYVTPPLSPAENAQEWLRQMARRATPCVTADAAAQLSAAVARMVLQPEPDPYAEARAAYADGELQVLTLDCPPHFVGAWGDWPPYWVEPKFEDPPEHSRRRPK